MKKIEIILALLFLNCLIFIQLFSQKIDQIVNKEIYTSYYSNDLKVPLYVVYYLNNGLISNLTVYVG